MWAANHKGIEIVTKESKYLKLRFNDVIKHCVRSGSGCADIPYKTY